MATRDLDLHVRQLVVGALLLESTPPLVVTSCSTDADAAPLHVAGCVAGLRLTALALLALVLRATAACSWTELP